MSNQWNLWNSASNAQSVCSPMADQMYTLKTSYSHKLRRHKTHKLLPLAKTQHTDITDCPYLISVTKKVKVQLCLGESGGTAPSIRNLGIIERSVVSFTTQPLYPGGKPSGIHCIGGWVDPSLRLDACENWWISCAQPLFRRRLFHGRVT